jgi:hypothetical protein
MITGGRGSDACGGISDGVLGWQYNAPENVGRKKTFAETPTGPKPRLVLRPLGAYRRFFTTDFTDGHGWENKCIFYFLIRVNP